MEVARVVARRATCPRLAVGAVLVRGNLLVALGYNGAPRGMPHCTDVGCRMVEEGGEPHCHRAVHSEVNSILNAALEGRSTRGTTLYVTAHPCERCALLIVQAGVERVVWGAEYRGGGAADLLRSGGVLVERYAERQYHGAAGPGPDAEVPHGPTGDSPPVPRDLRSD